MWTIVSDNSLWCCVISSRLALPGFFFFTTLNRFNFILRIEMIYVPPRTQCLVSSLESLQLSTSFWNSCPEWSQEVQSESLYSLTFHLESAEEQYLRLFLSLLNFTSLWVALYCFVKSDSLSRIYIHVYPWMGYILWCYGC